MMHLDVCSNKSALAILRHASYLLAFALYRLHPRVLASDYAPNSRLPRQSRFGMHARVAFCRRIIALLVDPHVHRCTMPTCPTAIVISPPNHAWIFSSTCAKRYTTARDICTWSACMRERPVEISHRTGHGSISQRPLQSRPRPWVETRCKQMHGYPYPDGSRLGRDPSRSRSIHLDSRNP